MSGLAIGVSLKASSRNAGRTIVSTQMLVAISLKICCPRNFSHPAAKLLELQTVPDRRQRGAAGWSRLVVAKSRFAVGSVGSWSRIAIEPPPS